MRTLQDLYASRCVKGEAGNLIPHFWKPAALATRPFCLLADERNVIEDRDVESCMHRLIALGLELELDVGKFVLEQSKGELPAELYVKELLLSAVSDEARHELGFKHAEAAYGSAERSKANALRQAWGVLADKYQPLAIAGVLEQQVFLVTLGLMRIVGGSSLSDLAMRIAEDESRHVATNRAITRWLGVALGSDVQDLVEETLAFAVGDMRVQVTGNTVVDYDFCIQQSNELRDTGIARKLDRLTRAAIHRMPFEHANANLYTARVSESGQSVY